MRLDLQARGRRRSPPMANCRRSSTPMATRSSPARPSASTWRRARSRRPPAARSASTPARSRSPTPCSAAARGSSTSSFPAMPRAFGEIANAKPFLALERRQLDPPDLSGKGQAAVSVRMPLKPGISRIGGRLEGHRHRHRSLEQGAGRGPHLQRRQRHHHGQPRRRLRSRARRRSTASSPMSACRSRSDRAARRPGPGERTARLTLDDAARKRFGIGLDEILGGTIGAQISNIEDGSKGQHYDLDLRRARVNMPGLGWSKGDRRPGDPVLRRQAGRERLPRSRTSSSVGAGFGFTGSAKLDPDYGLDLRRCRAFRAAPGRFAELQADPQPKNGYAIVAKGASFDLKGVIDQIENGGDHDSDRAGSLPSMRASTSWSASTSRPSPGHGWSLASSEGGAEAEYLRGDRRLRPQRRL